MKRLFLIPLILCCLLVAGVGCALLVQVSPLRLLKALMMEETLFALKFSFTTSCLAMLAAVVFGIPSAYFLAHHDFIGKGILDALLDLPLVMPPLVAGVGLLFLFGRDMLGGALADLGVHFIFTQKGAVLAQAFVATPILMRSARSSFESVDPGYEESARCLGLYPFLVFLRISLPLAGRGILAGVILAWARTMGEFGATLMVAGATRMSTETLPIAVYLNLSSGEMEIAVSSALALLGAAFSLLLLLRLIGRGGSANPEVT